MRHYEIVLLVHPDQSEEVGGIVSRLKASIERDGGIIHRLEDWGRRQLTYPIAKVHKAHYVLINVEVSSEALSNLRDALKYNDAIIRNLMLARSEAETERSKLYEEELAAQKAEEDRERRRKQELEERQRAREEAAKAADAANGETEAAEEEKSEASGQDTEEAVAEADTPAEPEAETQEAETTEVAATAEEGTAAETTKESASEVVEETKAEVAEEPTAESGKEEAETNVEAEPVAAEAADATEEKKD